MDPSPINDPFAQLDGQRTFIKPNPGGWTGSRPIESATAVPAPPASTFFARSRAIRAGVRPVRLLGASVHNLIDPDTPTEEPTLPFDEEDESGGER